MPFNEKFSLISLSGSPFYIDVEDSTLVVAKGQCLEASPVNKKAEFEIDPGKAPFRAEAAVKIICMS